MGKRERRACASNRPQWKRGETGIEVAWDFEARNCGASEWVSLTRRMSTRAEEERTMEDDAWQEAMARHELRDLDRERENEDGQSRQGHEARSSTRGDRLGVTDTPVCERFHGQRLWPPYTKPRREKASRGEDQAHCPSCSIYPSHFWCQAEGWTMTQSWTRDVSRRSL